MSTSTDTHVLGPRLRLWLQDHHDELVTFRRHLHSHPEPSWEEHATTDYVAERLEVAGLSPTPLSTGTGLMCEVGSAEGPVVALRADIDALAMPDDKEVHYRSRNDGVAHACGHDVHTTVVLATGLYLAHLGDAVPYRVRLLFQPAEETVPGGALAVIDDGGLLDVDTVLGVHCDPKLDVGLVGLRSGAVTSAADMVEIRLDGPGGHTARPELTVDMVTLAARLVAELPVRVSAALGDLGDRLKLVFGSLQTGDAANVIPSHALLRATVRTPCAEVWEALPAAAEAAVAEIVDGTGATATVDYVHGVPPVVNHPGVVATLAAAAAAELGERALTETHQSWGGDDYAWYLRHVPGAYVRLGVHDPSAGGPRLDLHAGHFDVDEGCIATGVRLLVAATHARRR